MVWEWLLGVGKERIREHTHTSTFLLGLRGFRKSWAPQRTSTWPPARSKSCQSLTAEGHRTASSFSPSMCLSCLFRPWWEGWIPQGSRALRGLEQKPTVELNAWGTGVAGEWGDSSVSASPAPAVPWEW